MSKSDDLKQVAALRKAIMPLVELMKADVNAEITQRLDGIEASLLKLATEGLRLETKAPPVNVVVETPPAITKALEKMSKATETKETVVTSTPQYEPHDQSSGAIKYNGFVAQDGSWYIQRLSKGQQRYALGKGNYQDAWSNKGKLTYGYMDGS